MSWTQKTLTLPAHRRGFHLITGRVTDALPDLRDFRVGMLHVFIQHTSASLALNENADPTVRGDMAAYFERAVPDGADYFEHTLEGPDDMSAHIRSVMTGSSVSIPIKNGCLALGTWQGIYLCEHRTGRHRRTLVLTVHGDKKGNAL